MSGFAELPQDKLDALRAKFKGRLPQRAESIRESRAAFAAGQAEALSELTRHVHSLKGSALQYGFDSLSASARSLESDLKALSGQGARELPAPVLASLDALLTELEHTSTS